ncbi:MAG: hypothetical protein KAG26_03860 [Methylococcales bacterium]|nr:hypothetical protein [Methylococcales bacterium]
MKTHFLLMITLFLIFTPLQAEEGTYATTEDGQGVVLYANGTWAFKSIPPPSKRTSAKKTSALNNNISDVDIPKATFRGKKGLYKIVYNANLWKKKKSTNSDADIQLEYKDGSGYAMLIFDRTPIALDKLKQQAVKNMNSVVSQVEIISEEKKQINGYKAIQLKIDSTIEDTPFSYLNYYVTGDWGTIQFVTYTAATLMPDYEDDFLDLLDGLSLKK